MKRILRAVFQELVVLPLAYCVAGLIALPWPYWNNHFEMAARAAADKVTKS
jgi:hypothetical protein